MPQCKQVGRKCPFAFKIWWNAMPHPKGASRKSEKYSARDAGGGAGEEAQIIIEEVANLLRSSTHSTNGPAGPGSATRAPSLASDLTSSLQSTQGRASTAQAGPSSALELSLQDIALQQQLTHANTEPPHIATGDSLLMPHACDVQLCLLQAPLYHGVLPFVT
jgi:hypothetical protein